MHQCQPQLHLEELEEAYSNCKAALAIERRLLFKGDSVHVATVLALLGQIAGQLSIKTAGRDRVSAQKHRSESISSTEECLELRLQLNGAKHVYTADAFQALGNFQDWHSRRGEKGRGSDAQGLKIRQRGAGTLGEDDCAVWCVQDVAETLHEAMEELAMMT